jgi:hypothetical protein
VNPQTIPVRPFMYAGFEVAIIKRRGRREAEKASGLSDWSVKPRRQLELWVDVKRCRRTRARGSRAREWFNRMRAVVEQAPDPLRGGHHL